jgi:hypothetical protein
MQNITKVDILMLARICSFISLDIMLCFTGFRRPKHGSQRGGDSRGGVQVYYGSDRERWRRVSL